MGAGIIRPRSGRVPERPKGAVCKIAGIAYTGSNPVPATRTLSCGNAAAPLRFPSWSLVRAKVADGEQRQAEVADLGQEAVQGRLVGDRPGDHRLARLVAGDLESL